MGLIRSAIVPFYCTKFVIAPVKGFRLARAMQECRVVFFHRKKKEQSQKCKQNKLLKNLFLLFVVIAREHLDT